MGMIKNIIKKICVGLLTFLPFSNAYADDCKSIISSTQGTEFWVAFLQNHDEELKIPHGLDLLIATDKTTDIRIENNVLYDSRSEDKLYHWNITLEANTSNVITVPCQLFNPNEYGEVIDRTLHIMSSEPISVYLDNRQSQSDDATLALPNSSLGTYYIIQTAEGVVETNHELFKPSIFSVIATENNTTVQITPSVSTKDGHPAGVPYTVSMHKGQLYQVESQPSDIGAGFSGTKVLSTTGQKIAVYAGNRMSNVPYNNTLGNSNNLFDVVFPVSKWGKNFIIQPYKTCVVDLIKVTASTDSTKIYKNGLLLATINAFETYEFLANEANGPFKLEASAPVEVYQYMTGNNYVQKRTNGGPSSQYIVPVEQAIDKVAFCPPNNESLQIHFVNLIVKTKDVGLIKLDGKANFAKFTPLDDTYSTGYVIISNNFKKPDDELNIHENAMHIIECPSGFIANMYGVGPGLSYAYCAGANSYDINTNSNTQITICEGDTVTFGGNKYTESGFYIDTLQGINGCDSLAMLTLKVQKSDTIQIQDTIKIGETYNKYGFLYTTPSVGIYNAINGACPTYNSLELIVEHRPCYDGTLVFKEDFGGNKSTDPAVSYDKIPQCSYTLSADPRDLYLTGRYSIRKVSYPDKPWANIFDHTYANRNDRGYFMQCDAANEVGKAPGVVYSVQIEDLRNDVPLFFSFWGMSMIKAGQDTSYSDAKLKMVIEDTEGNVLRTKNITLKNGKETWGLYGMPYQLPEGVTSAVFKILNNNTNSYGNDFAIDDIEIRFCKPEVDVIENENNSCIGTNLSLTGDFKNDGTYTEPVVYEWYYSKSSQIQSTDWVLIGKDKNLSIPNINEANNGYYRVFVGNAGSENIIGNNNPASRLIELNVKDCFMPVCNPDTINFSTCLSVDSLIDVLKNDSISNRDNAVLSLVKAPANAKVVGNMLSYSLENSELTTDTVIYAVKVGDFTDTASVIFKIDYPAVNTNNIFTICSGEAYKELVLFKDTVFSDTTYNELTGCPTIVNDIVNVINIDATFNDTAICYGDSAKLTIDSKAIYDEYTWYYDPTHLRIASRFKDYYLKATKDELYYVVIKSHHCTKEITGSMTVDSKPFVESVNYLEKDNSAIEITPNGGSAPYKYNLAGTWNSYNIIKNVVEDQEYKVQIMNNEGCLLDTVVKAPSLGIQVTPVVSPNGDGVNDYFKVKNIEKYPDATVTIFDRNGVQLVQYKTGENEGWDGYYNGHLMYKDDYWYVIEIKEIEKTLVGHFTLIGR